MLKIKTVYTMLSIFNTVLPYYFPLWSILFVFTQVSKSNRIGKLGGDIPFLVTFWKNTKYTEPNQTTPLTFP